VLDSFDKSDVVIIARAISVEKVPEFSEDRRYVDGVRTTTMVVERVFKGNLKVRDEIVFRQGGGADCIWTFSEKSVGQEFLFYLDTPEITATLNNVPDNDDKLWVAFGCGRSNNLSGATDDLLYLQNMTKVRGKTRISGTLGGWENPDLDVAGKTIRIIGAKKTYETKTNSEGVFEIYDLPPGKYLIEPQMPSGWKVNPYSARYSPSVERDEYGESGAKSKQLTIVLEPKKHAGVDISFTIDNAIHGSVVDPNSRPMAGVCLYLVHKDGSPGGGFG
jgi:hypothetical protein